MISHKIFDVCPVPSPATTYLCNPDKRKSISCFNHFFFPFCSPKTNNKNTNLWTVNISRFYVNQLQQKNGFIANTNFVEKL